MSCYIKWAILANLPINKILYFVIVTEKIRIKIFKECKNDFNSQLKNILKAEFLKLLSGYLYIYGADKFNECIKILYDIYDQKNKYGIDQDFILYYYKFTIKKYKLTLFNKIYYSFLSDVLCEFLLKSKNTKLILNILGCTNDIMDVKFNINYLSLKSLLLDVGCNCVLRMMDAPEYEEVINIIKKEILKLDDSFLEIIKIKFAGAVIFSISIDVNIKQKVFETFNIHD